MELRQEQHAVQERASEMAKRIRGTGRSMTNEEQMEYNDLIHQGNKLGKQVLDADQEECQEMESFLSGKPNQRSADGPQIPRDSQLEHVTTWQGRSDGSTIIRPDEIRALLPNQSFRAALNAEKSEICFGQYVKAAAIGPKTDAEKRALSTGSGTGGGFTVPEYLAGEFIDALRSNLVINAAGARTIPLEAANHSIAKLATDVTAVWHVENSEDLEGGDPTFAQIVLKPHVLAGLVRAPRELLEDSANAGEIIKHSLAKSLALALDAAAIFGDGANKPTGLANYPGLSATSLGTGNGAALASYTEILDLLEAQETANATPVNALAMAPRTKYELAKLADTTDQQLRRPAELENIPFLSSTIFPINEVEGTSSDASSILAGYWPDLLIGIRSNMVVEVLRETFAGRLQYGLLAYLRVDTAPTHVQSFRRLAGIIPPTA